MVKVGLTTSPSAQLKLRANSDICARSKSSPNVLRTSEQSRLCNKSPKRLDLYGHKVALCEALSAGGRANDKMNLQQDGFSVHSGSVGNTLTEQGG